MAIYQTGYGNFYKFSFEVQADGSYRAYIVRQPSYGERDTSSHIIHRLHDGATNRHYVCWNKALTTLEGAKKVAGGWATRTDRYILTGQPFKKQS